MTRSLIGSERAEEAATLRGQSALMYAKISPLGTATVNCPYCLLNWHVENPIDVTRFVDGDGKREVQTSCSKGHTLRFRTIDEWRERRIRAGIQAY